MKPLLFLGDALRTHIYVDGLNLYYGCLKGTKFKWLDLVELFSVILPAEYDIQKVNYFTAQVLPRNGNPGVCHRQNAYLRALEAQHPDKISIHYGYFSENNKFLRLVASPREKVEVIVTEEKRSDVSLSTHLLNDAWLDKYDCAVLVSNDNDMAEALKLIRQYHPKKQLWLIKPKKSQYSGKLQGPIEGQVNGEKLIREILPGALKKSLLPDPVLSEKPISKPASW